MRVLRATSSPRLSNYLSTRSRRSWTLTSWARIIPSRLPSLIWFTPLASTGWTQSLVSQCCSVYLSNSDIAVVKPSPLGTGGRIIFVSATLHYRGMPFQAHVSVAKAGIDALSHSVAIEYGPRGVTSNIIAPGPIAQTEVSSCLYASMRTFSSLCLLGLGTFVANRCYGSLYQIPATGPLRACP